MASAHKDTWSEILRQNRDKHARTGQPLLAVTPEEEERWSELVRQRREGQLRISQRGPMLGPVLQPPVAIHGLTHERLRTLPEYWHGIRRSKHLILWPALVCGSLALLFSLTQKPAFRAMTSVEVQAINENFLNMKDVDPTASTLSQESYLQTQAELLDSDAVMSRVAKKFLAAHPESKAPRSSGTKVGVVGKIKEIFAGSPGPANPDQDALDRVRSSIKIKPAVQSRIIKIISEDPNAAAAADLANTVASEFIDLSQESHWSGTQRTSDFLARQLAEVRGKLEKSEKELQEYNRQSGLIISGEKGTATQEKLKQLQEELSRAQSAYVEKRSQYEMAVKAQPDSVPAVLDNSVLGEYQVKLADMRRQLAELNSALTPTHFRVTRLQDQIAELQAAFEKKRGDILRRIANDEEAARRRESLLSAAYAEQARLLSDESGKEIKYNILKREVDANRQMYDALLQRVKEASVAAAMHATNIRIVDPARPPRKPFKPNVALNTLTGVLGGMLAALMFVVGREASDKTIRTLGESNVHTHVPELGVLPYAKDLDQKALPGGRGVLTEPRLSTGMADALRTALTSLLVANNQGEGPRTLAITSPGPGEGKTTVASNAAMLLAQMGQRVVLVDSDTRRPKLHEIFGITRNHGLSDLLNETCPVSELPEADLAEPTNIRGLYVMSAGPDLAGIGDLTYGHRMPEILNRLEREFDFVIIDTPPVLHLPTARIVGSVADAVILVIRFGHTTPEAAVRAAAYLRNDSSRLLGTILNSWDPAVPYYGYHAQYDAAGKETT